MAQAGSWGGPEGPVPLLAGRGPALLVLATWVLGAAWLWAEHRRGSSYQRRCGELEAAVSAQEARATEAERRLGRDEAERGLLRRQVSVLQGENRRLQEELESAAKAKRELEGRIDELAAELASYRARQTVPVATRPFIPVASAQEGPLPSDYRLTSGYPIQPLYGKGNGVLEVVNQGRADAIIKLVRPADRQCVAMFYVRSGETFPQKGIPDGSYTLYFATGYDYDYGSRDFKRGRETRKCDSSFDYSRIAKATFTLGTAFGNASSTRVPGSEFDGYKPPQ